MERLFENPGSRRVLTEMTAVLQRERSQSQRSPRDCRVMGPGAPPVLRSRKTVLVWYSAERFYYLRSRVITAVVRVE